MFKKFLSFPNHSIRVCVKGKKTNRGVGCGLEIPAEYFMAMRKLFNGQKKIRWCLWECEKKSFKMFKIKSF